MLDQSAVLTRSGSFDLPARTARPLPPAHAVRPGPPDGATEPDQAPAGALSPLQLTSVCGNAARTWSKPALVTSRGFTSERIVRVHQQIGFGFEREARRNDLFASPPPDRSGVKSRSAVAPVPAAAEWSSTK